MKALGWALVAFLVVSAPLIVLYLPVVDHAGPGWIGHVHLEWGVLKFVRIWEWNGRPLHPGALLVEIGVGVALGVLVFAAGRSLRGGSPEGKGGAV